MLDVESPKNTLEKSEMISPGLSSWILIRSSVRIQNLRRVQSVEDLHPLQSAVCCASLTSKPFDDSAGASGGVTVFLLRLVALAKSCVKAMGCYGHIGHYRHHSRRCYPLMGHNGPLYATLDHYRAL